MHDSVDCNLPASSKLYNTQTNGEPPKKQDPSKNRQALNLAHEMAGAIYEFEPYLRARSTFGASFKPTPEALLPTKRTVQPEDLER